MWMDRGMSPARWAKLVASAGAALAAWLVGDASSAGLPPEPAAPTVAPSPTPRLSFRLTDRPSAPKVLAAATAAEAALQVSRALFDRAPVVVIAPPDDVGRQ